MASQVAESLPHKLTKLTSYSAKTLWTIVNIALMLACLSVKQTSWFTSSVSNKMQRKLMYLSTPTI